MPVPETDDGDHGGIRLRVSCISAFGSPARTGQVGRIRHLFPGCLIRFLTNPFKSIMVAAKFNENGTRCKSVADPPL